MWGVGYGVGFDLGADLALHRDDKVLLPDDLVGVHDAHQRCAPHCRLARDVAPLCFGVVDEGLGFQG